MGRDRPTVGLLRKDSTIIMKHWTLAKPKQKSLYQQTIGNLYLRSVVIGSLYNDLLSAKSSGHKRFISGDLRALGEGDYIPGFDDGEPPKGIN
jgi:hypothetical protein